MSKMLTFILIGVAIGVLVAPDKGSATRSRLGDLLSDFADDARDQVKDLAATVKDSAGDVESAF